MTLLSLLEPGEAKRNGRRGLGTDDRRLSGKEAAGGGRGSDGVVELDLGAEEGLGKFWNN